MKELGVNFDKIVQVKYVLATMESTTTRLKLYTIENWLLIIIEYMTE